MQPDLSHLYEATPGWLDGSFAGITVLTVWILYRAIRQVSNKIAIGVLLASMVWLASLALLAHNHFFQQLDVRPPRFVLVMGLPLLLIVGLLLTSRGRSWTSQLPLSILTGLHTVRIPVELALYGLYTYQQVPQLMTFDGRNWDILAGLTAPVMAYFTFGRHQLPVRWLLIWNGLALGLLINIVTLAILSAPLPFQQLALSQPNVAVLKAPYVWLPGYIVSVVLFSHVVAIQRLIKQVGLRRFTPKP